MIKSTYRYWDNVGGHEVKTIKVNYTGLIHAGVLGAIIDIDGYLTHAKLSHYIRIIKRK